MLLALWAPKGGAGTSVFAAAVAATLAHERGGRPGSARLVDLAGDQVPILALGDDPARGVVDWLRAGPEVPADALDRLTIEAPGGLALVPAGADPVRLATADPAAGAALGVCLRDAAVPTVADVGAGPAATPAGRALLEVADVAVAVVRPCYLTLRRALRSGLLDATRGLVLVDEDRRSLGEAEVEEVLGRPILASVPVHPGVARVVDAGVLVLRRPAPLARAAEELLDALGAGGHHGRAA